MDALVRGLDRASNIRLIYANVTQTASTLARRHLSGPTAAQGLAQGLAAVTLLSADLDKEDERITLQLQVDGPLGGCMVEATQAGRLRGYTETKILNDMDGRDQTRIQHALGEAGRLTVMHSNSESVIYTGQVRAAPPDMRANLAKYYNESLQIPTGVELVSRTTASELDLATGLIAERMPDGDTEAFVRVLEAFNDQRIRKALLDNAEFGAIAELLGLSDFETRELRPVEFGCTCSKARIARVLATLTEGDLKEMVAEGEAQMITCHFCGETYSIEPDQMRLILEQKQEGDDDSSS